jgi:lysophospholipase L1-like esterase
MALARRDDWLQNAQGQALSGGLVYYCLQPANTGTIPPSPLANVYADSSGTPAANPQVTDGFGHAVAYIDNSQLYTIVYVHPQMGKIVLPDQWGGTGPQGQGFNDRGAWTANTTYAPYDIFTYGGSAYKVDTAYTSGSSFGSLDTSNAHVFAAGGTLSGTLSAPLVAPQGATITGGLGTDTLTTSSRKQYTVPGDARRVGWAATVVDSAKKILSGIDNAGIQHFFSKATFHRTATFQQGATINGGLTITQVTYGDQPAQYLSGYGRSGWLTAIVDASRKIIFGIKKDGSCWIGSKQVATVSGLTGVQQSFADAANYSTFTITDTNGKFQVCSCDKIGAGGTKQLTSSGSNNFNPRFTSDGTQVIFSTDRNLNPPLVRGLMYVPAAGGTEYPVFPLNPGTAICWGDSLTQGGEDGTGVTYETVLATLVPLTLTNNGIGGQTSTMIAARQGAYVPKLTVSGNAIPAAPGSVQVTAIDGNNIQGWTQAFALFLSSGAENYTHTAKGSLAGIHGTLTRTATGGPPSTTETYTFTPDAGTTGAACPANTPWTADPQGTDQQWQFIWVGRNDIQTGSAAEVQTVQNNITAMINFLKPLNKKICLLAVTNKRDGTENSGSAKWTAITNLNNWMRTTYPQYFVVDAQGRDVRQRLVASYNPSNSQDVTDFGNDVPPSSLMFDVTHPNQYGYTVVAQILKEFITARNLLIS